jgi:hypothetical protein
MPLLDSAEPSSLTIPLSKNLSGEFSTEDLDTIITPIKEALGVNILKID